MLGWSIDYGWNSAYMCDIRLGMTLVCTKYIGLEDGTSQVDNEAN